MSVDFVYALYAMCFIIVPTYMIRKEPTITFYTHTCTTKTAPVTVFGLVYVCIFLAFRTALACFHIYCCCSTYKGLEIVHVF